MTPRVNPRARLLAGAWLGVCLGCAGWDSTPLGPTVQVGGSYPGASSAETDHSLAYPLSTQLMQVPNVQNITSRSDNGKVEVTVQFAPAVDPWDARQRVLDAIQDDQLPMDAETWIGPIEPTETLVLGLSADLAPSALAEIADQTEKALLRVPGVLYVEVEGASAPSLVVTARPERLAGYELTAQQVADALGSANVQAGEILGVPLLRVNAAHETLDDVSHTMLLPGVTVGDVADLAMQHVPSERVGIDGTSGVLLTVRLTDAYQEGTAQQAIADLSLPVAVDLLPVPVATLHTPWAEPRTVDELATSIAESGADRVWWVHQIEDDERQTGPLTLWCSDEQALAATIRQRVAETPGIDARVTGPDSESHTLWVTAPSHEEARATAATLEHALYLMPQVLGTTLAATPRPQIHVEPDREALARLGLSTHDVTRALRFATTGVEATELVRGADTIPVTVRTHESMRDEDLAGLTVQGVPLAAIATLEVTSETALQRVNTSPAAALHLEVASDQLDAVMDALAEQPLPTGVTVRIDLP